MIDIFMKMIFHENTYLPSFKLINFGMTMTIKPVINQSEKHLIGMLESIVETNSVDENNCIGKDIRALRKSRSITLQQLADQLDRSVGFISQLERGLSEPSISDLRNIAALFEVPISLFFGQTEGDPEERGYVVR